MVVKSAIVFCMLILGASLSLSFKTSKANDLEPVKICFEEWAPYIYTKEDGSLDGLILPYVQILDEKIANPIQLKSLSYERCLNGVENGVFHGILMEEYGAYGMVPTKLKTAIWELAFLVRKGKYSSTNEVWKDETVLIGLTDAYEYSVDLNLKLLRRKQVMQMTHEAIIHGLNEDQVGAVMEDKAWLKEQIVYPSWAEFEILSPSVYTSEQYLNMHPDFLWFVDEVNKVIEAGHLEDEISTLF